MVRRSRFILVSLNVASTAMTHVIVRGMNGHLQATWQGPKVLKASYTNWRVKPPSKAFWEAMRVALQPQPRLATTRRPAPWKAREGERRRGRFAVKALILDQSRLRPVPVRPVDLIIMIFVRASILDVDKRVRSFAQRARTMCFSLDASPPLIC